MEMKINYSLKEKVILETALKIMFKQDFEFADIKTIAEHAMIPYEDVKKSYATDDALRMAAMEYAAVSWVSQLKYELKNIEGIQYKLKKLIRDYAAGSETHPDSLSLYIDVWKRLRDSKNEENETMRSALNKIYKFYVDVFKDVICDDFCIDTNKIKYLDLVAWIMVVISDGLHIQSLICDTPIDFDGIADVLYQMVCATLFSEEGK